MSLFFYVFLFVFWLLFGSFASVLIYRIRSWEKGILTGRSHCQSCKKVLKALHLIPLVSYIAQKGKCAHCGEKISHIYPLLELFMGGFFLLVWLFLIDKELLFLGDKKELARLVFYIVLAFITVIFIFYDILFLEISESVLFFWVVWAFLFLSYDMFVWWLHLVPWNFFVGLDVFSLEIFFLSAIILWLFYVILLAELKEVYDVLLLLFIGFLFWWTSSFLGKWIFDFSLFSWMFWAFIIFVFFFLQILLSAWKWMGWGDLRIALLMGLVLGTERILYGLLLSYFIGSVIGIIFVLWQKIKKPWQKITTIIPFWPFLGIGMFLALCFSQNIEKWLYFYL